jgi:L-malate glycosyltransferase
MTKILFVTPFFHRSGSELVLYNIISNLDNSKYEIGLVVTKTHGELLDLLPPSVTKFVYLDYLSEKQRVINASNQKLSHRIIRAFSKLINPSKLFPEEIKAGYDDFFSNVKDKFNADLWYINTILQPYAVDFAERNKIPCFVHTHEMEHMYCLLKENDLEQLINVPKLIIACSHSSARILKISGRKTAIEICYPCVDLKKIKPDQNKILEIRKKHKIDKNAFIWVMSGMLDFNKNPVKFVDICNDLNSQRYNSHFIWIGGGSESAFSLFARKKAKHFGVSSKITWTGNLKEDYYDYLNAADGFLLTSTFDSFPLVLIESAYLGKPIIGFNSGGISEFINNAKIGKVINSGQIKVLTEAMIKMMSLKEPGNTAISKRRAEDFDISVQLPVWEKIISNYI